MTPEESRALIVAAGGDIAFAKRLGLPPKKNLQQRVNNWRRRGIPASVVLDHYKAIDELKQQAAT